MSSGSRRGRYAVTFLFTLGLVAYGSLADAAEAGRERRDPALFSTDAVALHGAGWSLARVDHQDDVGGVAGAVATSLTLVDAGRTRAVQLELVFAGYGEQLAGYTRVSVAVPAERRVYEHQDALFDALAHGAVQRLYDECGSQVLALVDGDAELGEWDWYVVERRVEGKPAGAALAHELRTRLRAGAHVADVQETPGGLGFVLVDDARSSGADDDRSASSTTVIDVRLDAAGKIAAVEVRESPSSWSAGKLATEARLARALRGRSISRVSLSMREDTTRIRFDFDRGKGYVLDLADLVFEDGEGCGC
jgi:hypothetical protein